MKPIQTLLVGAGGYGNIYINFFRNGVIKDTDMVLAGVADPYAETSPGYEWLKEKNVPIYASPEAFFKEHTAELTIVVTPTSLHLPVSISALEHGSHVLCEKPLTSTLQEMDFLEKERVRLGKQLAVGFQWSFCDTMGKLKADILSGIYGRPLSLKTFISWPRPLSYYESSTWKGRIRDKAGNFILDSIVTNATAHYLHNIFFILGDTMQSAAMPDSLQCELYRAKDIESFDTCFLKGTAAGAQIYYAASHATDRNFDPKFIYEFENGVVELNHRETNNHVIGYFHDGKVIDYGNPFTAEEDARKCIAMADYIRGGELPRCTIPTARPHLLTCNAIFDYGKIYTFPENRLVRVHLDKPGQANIYCEGLYEELLACFHEGMLPSEKSINWSKPASIIPLDGYRAFSGENL